MKTRPQLRILGWLLLFAMLLSSAGCAAKVQAEDLMEGITPNPVSAPTDLSAGNVQVTDFSVRLLEAAFSKEENTLLAPLSVFCALGMTANGAEGQTLEQMEAVLGMDAASVNEYLYRYLQLLPQGEKYRLRSANSIWFTNKESFSVERSFLQTNADYYGADLYRTAFDRQTLKDINRWVKEETDGMIPEVLDEIPPEAVMYLINTIAFEAEWKEIYEKDQVRDGTFTKEDGTKQTVSFMYSEEGNYLSDGKATGFLKYYSGRKYAFVALLPNEGVSVEQYVASLSGEALQALLHSVQGAGVRAAIPKFESEYSVEMSEILAAMGMPNAFDPAMAEFGGVGSSTEGNLYINRVIHKTKIQVGEKGTRAGAVTVIEMNAESAAPMEPKEVYLNRPFVYMLVDCQNYVPFFIGTLMDPGK